MQAQSPFYLSRREYEDLPPIWLPPDFHTLEDTKPMYLIGTRGTGKTFLLRALWWKERLYNHSLRQRLGAPFQGRYIGIYMKTPNFSTKSFSNWPRQLPDTTAEEWEELCGQRFCLYLEITALQLLCEAITALRASDVLSYTYPQEEETVRRILERRPELTVRVTKYRFGKNLSQMAILFKQMHEELRTHALEKRTPDAKEFPVLQIGQYLMEIARELLSLCNQSPVNQSSDQKDAPKWRVRLCIDEAECLQVYQQRTINTLVRQIEHPISVIVSYVTGNADLSTTLLSKMTLSDADRTLRNLDEEFEQDRKRFPAFAEGVAVLRLQEALGSSAPIDIKKILPQPSINELILFSLKKSEKEWGATLLQKATELAKHPWFQQNGKRKKDAEQGVEITEEEHEDTEIDEHHATPRLYQQYLIDTLGYELDMAHRRLQRKRDFGSRNVSAMLCICRKLGVKTIPYAGFKQVIALSNHCIRDFLRQMDHLYHKYGKSAKQFCTASLSIKDQSEALKLASEHKLRSAMPWVKDHPEKVKSLIHLIGTLLAKVQGEETSLRSFSDVGEIQMKVDVKSKDHENLVGLIEEAAEAGLVTISPSNKSNRVKFSLHRLLAPQFGFTYRKPESTLIISTPTLVKLLAKNPDQIRDTDLDQLLQTQPASPTQQDSPIQQILFNFEEA